MLLDIVIAEDKAKNHNDDAESESSAKTPTQRPFMHSATLRIFNHISESMGGLKKS